LPHVGAPILQGITQPPLGTLTFFCCTLLHSSVELEQDLPKFSQRRQVENVRKEEIFPTRLKACRTRKGWTQQILAEKTGFSLSSIGNWEVRNPDLVTIPSPQKLGKLAEILGVTIEYLLGEDTAFKEQSPAYRSAASPVREEIYQHFHNYMDTCGEDPIRLGWTLVEIKSKFPLDKWEPAGPQYEQRGRAIVKHDPAVDAAARNLLDAASREVEKKNDPKK
jgi:transcriptional regulator with XRE-family HTH domain